MNHTWSCIFADWLFQFQQRLPITSETFFSKCRVRYLFPCLYKTRCIKMTIKAPLCKYDNNYFLKTIKNTEMVGNIVTCL